MAKRFDVILLTAFGKGYRLARDLAFDGLSVGWVDLTPRSGLRSKDWAPPFVTSVHSDATDLDRRQFLQDHNLRVVPEGFSLWSGEYSLSTGGEISQYQWERLGQPGVYRFLKEPVSPSHALAQRPELGAFKDHWFLHLASLFNKSHWTVNAVTGTGRATDSTNENGSALGSFKNGRRAGGFFRGSVRHFPVNHDFFGEHFVSEVDHSLIKKREQDLKVFGVKILKPQVMGLRFCDGEFSIALEEAAQIQSKSLVHFLTSEEIHALDPTFYRQVYRGEAPESHWHWQRFVLSGHLSVSQESLPPWLTLLEQWDLPWQEDNFLILRTQGDLSQWSLWSPVQTRKMDHARYRDPLLKKLTSTVSRKFVSPGLKVELDPLFTGVGDKGLAPFPLFKGVIEPPKIIAPLFFSEGVDSSGSFDAFDHHRQQKNLYRQIQGALDSHG